MAAEAESSAADVGADSSLSHNEAAQLVLSALKEAVGDAFKEYLELERKKSIELERIANALEHYNAQKFHTV